MIETITQWFADRFQFYADFFYQLLVDGATLLIEAMTYYSLKATLFSIQLSVDIAQQIMLDLKLNETIQGYWAMLPPDIASFLDYMGVPEGFQIVLTASVTRFVMGKVGVLT